MRGLFAVVIALLLVGGGYAQAGEGEEPRWREIAWPYPRDGWPAGRAFRCVEGPCGDAEVDVRPKLGFCNCDSGVADDDEVDRVADIDLISPRFTPREPGRVITVAAMPGRLRSYDLAMPDGGRHIAIAIAVSHRCDLLVALAQGTGEAAAMERAAMEFLDTVDIRRWMAAAMEGR